MSLSLVVGVSGSRTTALTWLLLLSTGSSTGNEIAAFLRRTIDQAMGVERRIAPVGGDLVMQIGLGRVPVPFGDDDVAFHPCGRGGLANGSSPLATRSVQSPNKLQGALGVEPVDRADHVIGWPARLDAALPGRGRLSKWPSCCSNIAGRLVAQLMAGERSRRSSPYRSHCCWLCILVAMPLPEGLGPVPGKSLLAGICSIEYQ